MIESIQDFFRLAMKREIGELLDFYPEDGAKIVNVGSGYQHIPGTSKLDYPEWNADLQDMPFENEAIDGIIAFHFLEHCAEPIKVLSEFQRVLKPGGVVWICVPYYSSNCAYQDLDHKCFFTEDTWRHLFDSFYYNKYGEWKFEVQFNIIIGVVERNLVLLTQLVKEE